MGEIQPYQNGTFMNASHSLLLEKDNKDNSCSSIDDDGNTDDFDEGFHQK